MFKIRREQKEAFAAAFGKMADPCTRCLIVRIVEIKGLYLGGYDDRFDPTKETGTTKATKPPEGTTKGASYVPGYASLDDKGRIFINRDVDGNWKRDTQGIDITVRVDPPSVPIPPGTMIEWSFEDPDDPSNENPRMHRDAGMALDPYDYDDRGRKIGANGNDNDPRHKAKAKPGFAQLEARYPLSGNKTPVDPLTRLSKVRFNVSDIAGDNFRVKANITPKAPITTTVSATTGVMTVWNRIDVEYVRMESADELPVGELAQHFDLAYAQIDISLKRVVSAPYDWPFMGPNEAAADLMCDIYTMKSGGQFTKAGEPGWFFLVAANRHVPESNEEILYEGDAFAHGRSILLRYGTDRPWEKEPEKKPTIVRVYNPQKFRSTGPKWPRDANLCTYFTILETIPADNGWLRLSLRPHDYHEVDNPLTSFLDADLGHYGFPEGARISIQIVTAGEETSFPLGISPGGYEDEHGHYYFAGRLIIFTKITDPALRTIVLCHELCHAFDNAHRCGNWDWTDGPERRACCMAYMRAFVLNDAQPRAPIRWTQNRLSADFCAWHLRHMRDYHLQNNPALKWK